MAIESEMRANDIRKVSRLKSHIAEYFIGGAALEYLAISWKLNKSVESNDSYQSNSVLPP